jgi:hypothetical protein
VHPTDVNTLLGGTQDNGSPATSTGTTSTSWINVLGGDGGFNAIGRMARIGLRRIGSAAELTEHQLLRIGNQLPEQFVSDGGIERPGWQR